MVAVVIKTKTVISNGHALNRATSMPVQLLTHCGAYQAIDAAEHRGKR